eukprot:4505341-Amphidinium_carterae.1
MLQTLIGKIVELKYVEENPRTGMPEHVKHIMKGKRLLLFEFLIKGAGIEDPEMMRSLMEGFPLVGQLLSEGWFPCRKESVDVVELTDLLKESAWMIPQLEATCKPSHDAFDDDQLGKKCEEEVARGWSIGPFTREDVDREHGQGKRVAAKGFAIWQSAAGQ